MKASLILCTKNGGERLQTCLDHIEALDWQEPLELFLVDNGSDDGISYAILERFAATSRFDTRVLRVTQPGNSAARNVAIKQASGAILVFIDDDCYVDPAFLHAWVEAFAQRDIGFGSGMVTRHDLRYSAVGCVEYPHERRLDPKNFIWRGFLQGSNMAFRRECLDSIGLFDERFGAGLPYSGEDFDISIRAGHAGWAGGYVPAAKVAHDHRRTEEDAMARRRYYDFGGGMIYAKSTLTRRGFESVKELRREFRRLIREHEAHRIWPFVQGYCTFLLKLSGGRGQPSPQRRD